MIICISGMGGAGKDAVAERLAKELNIMHLSKSFKDVSGDGQNLVKFISSVKGEYDKQFDEIVVKEAAKQDCVVSTWLGPWVIKDSTLNVWLNASLEERAKRKAKCMNTSVEEAKKYLTSRSDMDVPRWKAVYGIDMTKDHDVFDIELNTEKLSIEEEVSLIAMASLVKGGKRFR